MVEYIIAGEDISTSRTNNYGGCVRSFGDFKSSCAFIRSLLVDSTNRNKLPARDAALKGSRAFLVGARKESGSLLKRNRLTSTSRWWEIGGGAVFSNAISQKWDSARNFRVG